MHLALRRSSFHRGIYPQLLSWMPCPHITPVYSSMPHDHHEISKVNGYERAKTLLLYGATVAIGATYRYQ